MSEGARILVVEDDRDIRELMCEVLTLEGYEVHAAANGADAVQLLDKIENPCLIFLDLMMPVMDGKEFLEWRKSTGKFVEIPVIVISAIAKKGDPQGATAYIKKPVDLDKIVEVASEQCRAHTEASESSDSAA